MQFYIGFYTFPLWKRCIEGFSGWLREDGDILPLRFNSPCYLFENECLILDFTDVLSLVAKQGILGFQFMSQVVGKSFGINAPCSSLLRHFSLSEANKKIWRIIVGLMGVFSQGYMSPCFSIWAHSTEIGDPRHDMW